MKFRVLSDLHLDVNKDFPLYLDGRDKDMFTVLCGDTAGDPLIVRDFLDEQIKRGVFISGNHLVYNKRNKAIQELREEMAWEHGANDPITYLDCLTDNPVVTKEHEGILFVGSTMYTDFMLRGRWDYHGEGTIDDTMIRTRNGYNFERCMNDCRWGEVYVNDLDHKRPMNYKDYVGWYEKWMIALVRVLNDNPDKEIVVVTHHCPSPKCIDDTYVDSEANPGYVVDLENFIKEHKNIKCWCCGHVHHQDSFKIDDCLIVMNPRGYVVRCEDEDFDKRLYVDTKDWTVHKHKKTKAEQKEYDQRRQDFMAWSRWFL